MLSSASPSPSSNASNIQINNTTLSQLFINQRLIESFLRKSILLKIIEAAACQYTKNYQQTKRPEDTLAAVIVQLPFAYKDFLDSPKELLNLTIDEPIQFMNAVKYCVYSLIRDFVKQTSSETGLKSIDIEQVHVQLRFIGLPYQQHLCFDPSKNLYPTNLCSVLGILTALTEPEKCVIQTVWFCSTGCLRNKIKKNSTEAPQCNSCSRSMSEYSKLRSIQNYHLLRLVPTGFVQTPIILDKVFRAVLVRVKEHNYNCKLKLGGRYLVTGYYDYNKCGQ